MTLLCRNTTQTRHTEGQSNEVRLYNNCTIYTTATARRSQTTCKNRHTPPAVAIHTAKAYVCGVPLGATDHAVILTDCELWWESQIHTLHTPSNTRMMNRQADHNTLLSRATHPRIHMYYIARVMQSHQKVYASQQERKHKHNTRNLMDTHSVISPV